MFEATLAGDRGAIEVDLYEMADFSEMAQWLSNERRRFPMKVVLHGHAYRFNTRDEGLMFVQALEHGVRFSERKNAARRR